MVPSLDPVPFSCMVYCHGREAWPPYADIVPHSASTVRAGYPGRSECPTEVTPTNSLLSANVSRRRERKTRGVYFLSDAVSPGHVDFSRHICWWQRWCRRQFAGATLLSLRSPRRYSGWSDVVAGQQSECQRDGWSDRGIDLTALKEPCLCTAGITACLLVALTLGGRIGEHL